MKVIIPTRGPRFAKKRLRKELSKSEISQIVENLLRKSISFAKEMGWEIVLVCPEELDKGIFQYDSYVQDDGSSLDNAIATALSTIDDPQVAILMPDLPEITTDLGEKINALISLNGNLVCPTQKEGTALAVLPREMYVSPTFTGKSSTLLTDRLHLNKIPFYTAYIKELRTDIDEFSDYMEYKETLIS